MDGQTYQIKLNINVDDSQLSKADPGAVDNGEMGVVRGVETILTSPPADAHITGRWRDFSIENRDYRAKDF